MLRLYLTIRKIINLLIMLAILMLVLQLSAQENSNQWDAIEGDGTLRRIYVPILMYHYVSELPPDADAIRTGLTLHPDIFRQHIQFLAENGYTSISLQDVDDALETGSELPENPVILTFDDGYIDAYTDVFPILQSYNMIGTFFIITQFADDNAQGYMNWSQINEMAQAGMNMEGHTKTHPTLIERELDFLVYEVIGSLESLNVHTGINSEMIAYPVGRYDENTLRFMDSTEIERAVTTEIGAYHTTDNRYQMMRLRITNETGVAGLDYLLNYGR
ncbi:MAG: hypothetical protein Phog2KO_03450 [Phototrophicaceae bacterium]